jgi:hypothetical protein
MAFATIDVTKGITGTIPVTNGGTGLTSGTTDQFLKFTGTTTLASAADNAGAMVLIKTQTASGSSSINFINGTSGVVFDSTYKTYFIKGHGIVAENSGPELMMQITTDGGSSYKTSGYNSGLFRGYTNGSDHGTDWDTRTNGFYLMRNSGNGADDHNSIQGYINEATGTGYPQYSGMSVGREHSGTYVNINCGSGGVYMSATAFNGFRILYESGNINEGVFSLYGLVE